MHIDFFDCCNICKINSSRLEKSAFELNLQEFKKLIFLVSFVVKLYLHFGQQVAVVLLKCDYAVG